MSLDVKEIREIETRARAVLNFAEGPATVGLAKQQAYETLRVLAEVRRLRHIEVAAHGVLALRSDDPHGADALDRLRAAMEKGA